jgi:hypothetical protein
MYAICPAYLILLDLMVLIVFEECIDQCKEFVPDYTALYPERIYSWAIPGTWAPCDLHRQPSG